MILQPAMLEILKIKLFGHEPAAKVTDKMLERIIRRDYGYRATEVKQKLQQVVSDSVNGKNRISAAILKLANKDIKAIDHFIEVSNNDYRDVLSPAEYPGIQRSFLTIFQKVRKSRLIYLIGSNILRGLTKLDLQ
jgi:hypothetical protein